MVVLRNGNPHAFLMAPFFRQIRTPRSARAHSAHARAPVRRLLRSRVEDVMAREARLRIFSTTEALRFGWRTTMANLKPLLAIGAVGFFLGLVRTTLLSRQGGIGPLLSIGIQVLQALVAMALMRVSLRLHDGQTIDWGRPGDLVRGFFTYLLTAVLYGLIIAVGLVLLVVPGIIWAVVFGLATFVAVDRGLDPIASLKESRRLTKGERWHLFLFGLLLIGVNLLGALALGIGLLVTIPTTTLAAAFVYRRLESRVAFGLPDMLPLEPATTSP
jgi:uncharacterized membrane protein